MIKIDKIYKKYDNRTIFEDLSLIIEEADFLVIEGKSGSGKTTLLNLIGGIDKPDSGDVEIDGLNTKNRIDLMKIYREKVGFLFQNFALVDNKTVYENLMFVDKSCRNEIDAASALDRVGLSGFENRKVHTLSGGEQQRVAIARLFIKKCKIILADEPTGNLDWDNGEAVLGLLNTLNEKGKTVVLVTHDERVKNYAKNIIRI